MRSFLFVFVVALVASLALVPLALRLSWTLGAISQPGGRHIHARPVGRLGGLAIAGSSYLAIALLLCTQSSVAQLLGMHASLVSGIFLGSLGLVLLGFLDDVRSLPAWLKLLIQVGVAVGAYASGCRIEGLLVPGLGTISLGWLSPILTVLWIVGVVNAINLIDGLDGLAAGIVCFASLTNFVVGFLADATWPCLLSAAIGGSTLGFLAYNTYPARIFMGDSGSYFLGFVLATSSLLGASQKASTSLALAVPILSMGVPIFDTLFAMVRRLLQRRSLFAPDRGHVHHRLLDLGITHRRVVLTLYAVSAVFTALALVVTFSRNPTVGLVLAGTSLLAILGWSTLFGARRRLENALPPTAPRPDASTEPNPREQP